MLFLLEILFLIFAMAKTPEEKKREAFEAVSKEEQLREDAYGIASKAYNDKEYPYIPTVTIWVALIELKYSHLSAHEVFSLLLKRILLTHSYIQSIMIIIMLSYISLGAFEFKSELRFGGE